MSTGSYFLQMDTKLRVKDSLWFQLTVGDIRKITYNSRRRSTGYCEKRNLQALRTVPFSKSATNICTGRFTFIPVDILYPQVK